jgi:GT2 family glycosyltransferase
MNLFKVVSATPADELSFGRKPLGRALNEYYRHIPIDKKIYYANTRGLPTCYNEAIAESAGSDQILIFVHDDVFFLDFYWMHHLVGALEQFDVVGVIGNKRRAPHQPLWNYLDEKFTRDDPRNYSGAIVHGLTFPANTFPFEGIVYCGAVMEECKILDGVFLAARAKVLTAAGLAFDERFTFHFYDVDFCRQAEHKGLKMGTAPISLLHESGGTCGPDWQEAYRVYKAKWPD